MGLVFNRNPVLPKRGVPGGRARLRIWIDLDNTPHTVFFRPIIDELQRRGHDVLVTARNDGRTVELARYFSMAIITVGRGRGISLVSKVWSTLWRAAQLLVIAGWRRPDIAVSHGSRPLVIAAALLRVPIVTMYDYEGISSALFNRLSRRVLIPGLVPRDRLLKRGLDLNRLVSYPGIKEDVYLHDFRPTANLRERLGLAAADIVVLLRPESDTAHYRPTDPLPIIDEVMRHLSGNDRVRVVLLPRSERQALQLTKQLASLGIRYLVPDPMDGRDLIWNSDLVVSGGGTMIREAAALGVPAYSIFQGELGAIDAHLVNERRLVLVRAPEDVWRVRLEARRVGSELQPCDSNPVVGFLADEICAILS